MFISLQYIDLAEAVLEARMDYDRVIEDNPELRRWQVGGGW